MKVVTTATSTSIDAPTESKDKKPLADGTRGDSKELGREPRYTAADTRAEDAYLGKSS